MNQKNKKIFSIMEGRKPKKQRVVEKDSPCCPEGKICTKCCAGYTWLEIPVPDFEIPDITIIPPEIDIPPMSFPCITDRIMDEIPPILEATDISSKVYLDPESFRVPKNILTRYGKGLIEQGAKFYARLSIKDFTEEK